MKFIAGTKTTTEQPGNKILTPKNKIMPPTPQQNNYYTRNTITPSKQNIQLDQSENAHVSLAGAGALSARSPALIHSKNRRRAHGVKDFIEHVL